MSQTVNQDINNFFINSFEQFELQLNGSANSAFHSLRKEAINAFKESGLPWPKHEEYKYTAIAKRMEKSINFEALNAENKVSDDFIAAKLFEVEDANQLVFINGVYSERHSKIVSDKKALQIQSLNDAIQHNCEELTGLTKHFDNLEKDAFNYLNTAFAHEGLYIKIAKGKAVEEPILIYYFSSENAFAQPRNIILAEANAQAKFSEAHYTENGISFNNTLSQFVLQQDAIVDHYKIQMDNDESILIAGTQAVHLGKSIFNSVCISLSGGMIRNNIEITQKAEHCESNMYGLYMLGGKSHVDNHTIVDHTAPNSESNELYKGIMEGKATAVFNGKIFVRQAAQKTNAFQSNRNVLLSDSATVNTKPQLEIWADDVKCSHGCTVGQLDQEQLIYLRTRGISKASARAMLLAAFAEDVLNHIKIEPIHAFLTSIIIERLENSAV